MSTQDAVKTMNAFLRKCGFDVVVRTEQDFYKILESCAGGEPPSPCKSLGLLEAESSLLPPEDALVQTPQKIFSKNLDIQKLEVGEEVVSWCGKCKDFTLHTAKVLQPPKPPKSVCLTCRAIHQIRLKPGLNYQPLRARRNKSI